MLLYDHLHTIHLGIHKRIFSTNFVQMFIQDIIQHKLAQFMKRTIHQGTNSNKYYQFH